MTEHDDTAIDVPTGETDVADEPGTPDLTAIRELVLRAHPDVVPELVTGDTVDALLASVEPAQAAWQRLAERLRNPADPPSSPSVPAGGDRPLPVDPERLPAGEKIRRGLAARRR